MPDHEIQHLDLAALGGVGMRERIVLGRGLRQPREVSGFGQREVARRLSEIAPRGRFDTGEQPPVRDVVQVPGEDLVLRVPGPELQRQRDLAELPFDGALRPLFRRLVELLHELLGDGAAARAAEKSVTRTQILEHRPGEPLWVHARVGVEAGVFGGNGRPDNVRRDFVERYVLLVSALPDELVQKHAVTVVDARAVSLQRHLLPGRRDVGDRAGVIARHQGRHRGHGCEEQPERGDSERVRSVDRSHTAPPKANQLVRSHGNRSDATTGRLGRVPADVRGTASVYHRSETSGPDDRHVALSRRRTTISPRGTSCCVPSASDRRVTTFRATSLSPSTVTCVTRSASA